MQIKDSAAIFSIIVLAILVAVIILFIGSVIAVAGGIFAWTLYIAIMVLAWLIRVIKHGYI